MIAILFSCKFKVSNLLFVISFCSKAQTQYRLDENSTCETWWMMNSDVVNGEVNDILWIMWEMMMMITLLLIDIYIHTDWFATWVASYIESVFLKRRIWIKGAIYVCPQMIKDLNILCQHIMKIGRHSRWKFPNYPLHVLDHDDALLDEPSINLVVLNFFYNLVWAGYVIVTSIKC